MVRFTKVVTWVVEMMARVSTTCDELDLFRNECDGGGGGRASVSCGAPVGWVPRVESDRLVALVKSVGQKG